MIKESVFLETIPSELKPGTSNLTCDCDSANLCDNSTSFVKGLIIALMISNNFVRLFIKPVKPFSLFASVIPTFNPASWVAISLNAAPKLYPASSAALVTSPNFRNDGTAALCFPVNPSIIPCNAGTRLFVANLANLSKIGKRAVPKLSLASSKATLILAIRPAKVLAAMSA